MPEYVPPIATLRARAAQLIGHQIGRGELKAMLAAICAAENAGTPIPADSTGQTWITEASGIINQADQDALAILVREFAELVENLSGSSGGPPAVIAPFPGIGDEGVFYSQQVRTTGATPQTFATTIGALPTGLTLDAGSGLITGIVAYPNGGFYSGSITITNAAGSVVYDFQIVIDGTVPTLLYNTGTFTYLPPGAVVCVPLVEETAAVTATGSTGGSPASPLAFTLPTSPSGTNFTIDSSTGEISVTAPISANGNSYAYTARVDNYFGHGTFSSTMYVFAPMYLGEWHGALPGAFTESDILTGLFDNTTPGPRVLEGEDVYAMMVGGTSTYPATSSPYFRVLAFARGFNNGNISQALGDGTPLMPYGPPGGLAEFDPPWPDTYQSDLLINGIPYQIYVYAVGATTGAFDLLFLQNLAPVPPLIGTSTGYVEFLQYIGDPNFLSGGRHDEQDSVIQVEVISGAGPFTYSTSGTLPSGLSWNSGTQQITGTPNDGSQVFERFIFTITATGAGGESNALTLYIALSAPIYWGEQAGALPGSFTSANITSGLYNNGTPGPRVYPAPGTDVHGVAPGVYVMSAAALGFTGVFLPGFYGHGESDQAYYPATFYCPVTASTIKVFAVPSKFLSGSWPQDPYGVGATRTFNPVVGYIFGGSGVATFNPAWPTPYQSSLMIDVNGIPTSYDIYILQGATGLYFQFS